MVKKPSRGIHPGLTPAVLFMSTAPRPMWTSTKGGYEEGLVLAGLLGTAAGLSAGGNMDAWGLMGGTARAGMMGAGTPQSMMLSSFTTA